MLSGGTALTVTASPVHVDFPSNDNPACRISRDYCNAACACACGKIALVVFRLTRISKLPSKKKPAMYRPRTREAMGYDTTAYHMSLVIAPQMANSASV